MSQELQVSTATSTSETTPTMSSAFSTKQILSRSVRKTVISLPSSPGKKAEVIGTLSKKFNQRIAVHIKSGKKKEWIKWRGRRMNWELYGPFSGIGFNWLKATEPLRGGSLLFTNKFTFYHITYTTSGRRDPVYVGMDGGKREYKEKRYLLWKLRDLLEIINGSKIIISENFPSFTEAFEYEFSFRQMYNFLKMHKEVT